MAPNEDGPDPGRDHGPGNGSDKKFLSQSGEEVKPVLIPVMDRYARGFPEHAACDKSFAYGPIGEVLTHSYAWDAHFAAYSVPSICRRLAGDAPTVIPGGVPMVLAVFDVDGKDHETTDEWLAGEGGKVAALLDAHPGGFIYTTSGGYRIIYTLPEPVLVERKETWTALYLSWCRYMDRRFGIIADTTCKPWPQPFRLPFVVREDGKPPTPPDGVAGDPADIGTWVPELAPELVTPSREPVEPRPFTGEINAYARGALDKEIEALSTAKSPGRNARLNRAAFSLGQLIGGGELPRDVVAERLLDAVNVNGLASDDGEDECRRTIGNGLDAGVKEPRTAPKMVTFGDLYSPEELAQIATEQRCAVDDLGKRWIIRRRDACYVLTWGHGYKAPISKDELRQSLPRDLRRAPVNLTKLGKEGASVPLTVDEILDRYATVARRSIANLALERSYYDADTETFHEAVCPRRRLEPRFYEQIDTWLRILGGDHAERLLDWLATVMQLDRQTSALYLVGRRGAGKGMLAEGLARLWHEAGPSSLTKVLGSFNSILASCPLVFCDEKLPPPARGRATSAEIRELIGSESRILSRKYAPDAPLVGALRFVFAANHEIFHFDEEMTAEDNEAVAERIFRVDVPARAAEYLVSLGSREGTDGWVDGDLIARHVLWLAQNREVPRDGRWIVRGNYDPRELVISHPDVGRLFEVITRRLYEHKDTCAILGNGRLLVSTGELQKVWPDDWKPSPTLNRLAAIVAKVGDDTAPPEIRIGKRRYRAVRPELFLRWYARVVGDPAEMTARIGSLEPVRNEECAA
jgi:hypothetical protein